MKERKEKKKGESNFPPQFIPIHSRKFDKTLQRIYLIGWTCRNGKLANDEHSSSNCSRSRLSTSQWTVSHSCERNYKVNWKRATGRKTVLLPSTERDFITDLLLFRHCSSRAKAAGEIVEFICQRKAAYTATFRSIPTKLTITADEQTWCHW